MKGWAAIGGVLAGAAVQQMQATLHPGSPWVAALALAGAACLGLALLRGASRPATSARAGRRAQGAAVLAIGLMALMASWGATEWRASLRVAQVLQPALEGQDLQVVGTISGLPDVELQGTRFVLAIESVARPGLPPSPVSGSGVPPRVRLTWWRGADGARLWQAPPEPLQAGQRWAFTVRLKRPHGLANPQGFDAERWLFEQGIGATGHVRVTSTASAQRLEDAACCGVSRLRQALRDRLAAAVDDPARAGVLAALMVGDQAAIDPADWSTFQATGVAHLMSISGLHVTMWAWMAAGLCQALWRRRVRWHRWMAAPQAGRLGGLLAATAYALLAGWGVPAQRTVVMLAVVVALTSGGCRWPARWVLGTAAAVVVAFDPWALGQPGFWLSFVAVGLLMASDPATGPPTPGPTPPGRAWRRVLWDGAGAGLRAQAIATVGLAPLTLVFFQQISTVGFVANLLAVPVVTLLITPLVMAGALLPPLWWLADAVLAGLMAALQALAAWPAAVWHVAVAPAWALAAGLLGGAVAVMPLPWRLRLLGVPLMLPLLWPSVPRPAPGQFELVAVDVGQGTAVLVRTRAHLLVFDAGPAWGPGSDAGARVLLPLLRARGERRIDRLMLSHRDTDHTGGAGALLAGLPVGALHTALEPGHPLREAPGGPAHQTCEAGQRWHWDGVDFEVLHPAPGRVDEAAAPARANTVSCVLRVASPQGSVLLTGDIEAAQEATLVQSLGPSLRSDVLLVPHHGSRTSSSEVFLDAVAPRIAVVQAGYRSRYGHPAPAVMRRYGARSIAVVRSDTCGAWTWPAGAHPTLGLCTRGEAPRYWHHRAEP